MTMGQGFFKFKQFDVWQDRCAMKICTDACILGATVASSAPTGRLLDIGAGTGLLSLMIAQKSSAQIHALEIEPEAALQCQQNFQSSPWPHRLTLIPLSLQEYTLQADGNYDFIVSNPPFYVNNLRSGQEKVNLAYHCHSLSHETFLGCSLQLLSPEGILVVMMPAFEAERFVEMSGLKNIFPFRCINIRHTAKSKILRKIIFLCKVSRQEVTEENFNIKDSNSEYTSQFASLLQDYYTIF